MLELLVQETLAVIKSRGYVDVLWNISSLKEFKEAIAGFTIWDTYFVGGGFPLPIHAYNIIENRKGILHSTYAEFSSMNGYSRMDFPSKKNGNIFKSLNGLPSIWTPQNIMIYVPVPIVIDSEFNSQEKLISKSNGRELTKEEVMDILNERRKVVEV